MAFDDLFRMSVHAVITDSENKILLLKATYGLKSWGLPGGALEPGETIHEALIRECKEETNLAIKILYMSGMYYHSTHNSQAGVFRCEVAHFNDLKLSPEHSEYGFFSLEELSPINQQRVKDCFAFDGFVKSAKF